VNAALPFFIWEATAADNILLAGLGWQCFNQAFAAANTAADMAAYLSQTFSPTLQATQFADPLHIFWLVYVQEEAVGYVKLFTGKAPACVS
jgi:diamine N-acetyltransferase